VAVTLPRGKLRHRIQLQAPAQTVDGLGQAVETWTTQATVWASAEPLRGREFFAAGQGQAQVDVRFVLNWRADVLPSWRVLWRGQVYAIGAVIDTGGERVQLELMAASIAAAGIAA
jgi:SPP1 family predicted phage head-tail adaptor